VARLPAPSPAVAALKAAIPLAAIRDFERAWLRILEEISPHAGCRWAYLDAEADERDEDEAAA
jgi:hypothetical protein